MRTTKVRTRLADRTFDNTRGYYAPSAADLAAVLQEALGIVRGLDLISAGVTDDAQGAALLAGLLDGIDHSIPLVRCWGARSYRKGEDRSGVWPTGFLTREQAVACMTAQGAKIARKANHTSPPPGMPEGAIWRGWNGWFMIEEVEVRAYMIAHPDLSPDQYATS